MQRIWSLNRALAILAIFLGSAGSLYLWHFLLRETKYQPGLNNLELLRFLWADAAPLVAGTIMTGTVLLFLGVATLALMLTGCSGKRWGWVAAALLFLGALLCHAAVVPPFHIADEPSHFWSYTHRSMPTAVVKSLPELAQKTHFARLVQNPKQRFSPEDRNKEWREPWGHHAFGPRVVDSRMERRSWLVDEIWLATFPKTSHAAEVAAVLLKFRIVNACISGLILGILFFALMAGSPLNLLAASPLLLVPAFPHFLIGVSNFVVFAWTALLQIAGGIALYRNLRLPNLWAILLGGATALSLSASLLGLFQYVILIFFVWVLVAREKLARGPLALILLSSSTGYFLTEKMPWRFIPHRLIHQWTDGAVAIPTVFLLGMASLVLFSAVLRYAYRSQWGNDAREWLSPPKILCAFIALLFLQVLFRVPSLPDIEGLESIATVDTVMYAIKLIAIFWNGLVGLSSDFYVVRSFWSGFLWLELALPELWIRGLAVTPAVLTLICCWRSETARASSRDLLVLAIAISVMLVSQGIAGINSDHNIHGRYLIGTYVATLSMMGAILSVYWPPHRNTSRWSLILLNVICIVQSASIILVARRFFR